MSPTALQETRSSAPPARPYKPDDAAIARAKANIEAIRKREIELRLIDRGGRPVAHASIELIQTKHHFLFGGPLSMSAAGQPSLFRAADVPMPSALDQEFEHSNSPCGFIRTAMDAALVAGRPVLRGATLFNPAPPSWPERFREYDVETQGRFLEVAVRRSVHRFRGRLGIRDAVCGALWEPAPDNASDRHWPHLEPIGDLADSIEPIFHWCRDEDPDAVYSLSDHGLESDAGAESPLSADGTRVTAPHQRRRMLALANELMVRGNPPDALGIVADGAAWISHSAQLATYDELGASRLPLHIAGFSPSSLSRQTVDPIMMDQYAANYLTCAFGHAAIEGFFLPPSIAAEAAASMTHLVENEWKTHLRLRSDADGRLRVRAFLGDYTLRYRMSDRAQRGLCVSLTPETPSPLILVTPFARSEA